MHGDARRADGFHHRVADTPFGIMVLDGEDAVVGRPRGLEERGRIDGLDAEEIDDTHRDTRCRELRVRGECLV